MMNMINAEDAASFGRGQHSRLYRKLGARRVTMNGTEGAYFAVWAPNAERVSVIGDFNGWDPHAYFLRSRDDASGIWEGFIAGVGNGARYKYHLISKYNGYEVDKGDPFAFYWERPPLTGSILWSLDYEWGDRGWMGRRREINGLDAPWSIYEVHLGSWRRVPEEADRSLSYRELATPLADYVTDMGYTHIEFLPLTEHPFYGSWGYQSTGFFAPTARYGTPQDLMYLVDYLHQRGIGVILDWVPSHFPDNENGLVFFDGTHLYEHADPRQGFHPEWNSYIFNYGRNEVRAFLVSSALFWFDLYHVDAIRVDAVASMLYRDYARKPGEWIPNQFGGRENLEAVEFLKQLNQTIYREYPDVQTIAEESTAWPRVSRPVYLGGLGFGMKWNMGWMHDTLAYFETDSLFRKFHHDQLTFSLWYAFHENFILPLSHDEVVHGKGALIGKMPGDEWQEFANLRLLLGYMWAHPGKKLLFMGAEFGQRREWQHEESLEWHVLQYPVHEGVRRWVRDLNRFYRSEPALHQVDFSSDGFQWVDRQDWEQSVLSFLRFGRHHDDDVVLVVCNFTPVPRMNYRIGVPYGGYWKEMLNSDASVYDGSGLGNFGGVEASPLSAQGRFYSLSITLPPLGMVFLKPQAAAT
jgi:1,4-alpha-glucan branching enzyme